MHIGTISDTKGKLCWSNPKFVWNYKKAQSKSTLDPMTNKPCTVESGVEWVSEGPVTSEWNDNLIT